MHEEKAQSPTEERETPAEKQDPLYDKVVEVLRTVFDPEIPVNIYELGLIYHIEVDDQAVVYIRLTLTSPMCPVAGSLPPEVEMKVRNIPGVSDVKVELVWDPPWSPDKMSDAAKLQLGMF
jgi:FeS assembly SUF system protein